MNFDQLVTKEIKRADLEAGSNQTHVHSAKPVGSVG